jgi:hypothetical protein
MTKSPGGWAPWLFHRKRQEEQPAQNQAPAPAPSKVPKEPSGETKPQQSVIELYRSRGFRIIEPSGKGYILPAPPPGKRPDQRVRPSSKR